MNSTQVKGSFKETKGKVKEEIGHLTGNDKTEASGVIDQVKGKIEKGFGDLKDAVKDGVDSVLNHGKKHDKH